MDIKTIMQTIKKHGSKTKAAKALGISRFALLRILKHHPEKKIAAVKEDEPVSTKKSLAAFREKYDKSFIVPKRIKAALKKLGNGWEYEMEFAKTAGVSLGELAAYRDQFNEYVVQIERSGRRAWTGSKTTAEQMRRMV